MKPFVTVFALAALLCGCGGAHHAAPGGGDTVTRAASLLTIVERPGWVEASVADPWREGHVLARYALVADSAADTSVPDGYTLVRVPLRRSIVYSSIHTAAIDELGAAGAIAAVADGDWLSDSDPVKARIAAGDVADLGPSMSPSVEMAVGLEPDAILLSPYESGGRGGIERAGAPLVEMADYMEPTPHGRAEWLLLMGYLYGVPGRARGICDSVAARYDSIAAAVAQSERRRPRVLTERPQSGVWYVPAGGSYMARLIADAGGDYAWADEPGSGSLALDAAAVLDRAADADYWLLKEYGGISEAALASAVPLARGLNAYPRGVRVCDTRATGLYLDLAIHPDRVLSDMAAVFAGADSTIYFRPLAR